MGAPVWKRMLKGLAWVVGGTLGLVVIAYLALCLINWRDRPVSESAAKLATVYRDRPAVSDADNAYPYVMGFADVPSAQHYRSIRAPQAQSISDACRLATSECARAFEGGEDVMREWTRSEQWLLDRYLTLVRHSGWLETVPDDVSTGLPKYALVFDGQKLLLAKAYLLASEKDAAGVRALLGDDVRFWRRVLASSDILITKMIAVAALNRTFGVGNLVLRRLPANLQLAGMPPEWTTQLTDTERSLLRPFTGEWIFGDRLFHQVRQREWWRDDQSEGEGSFANRLLGHALLPLFQPQDLSNRRADMFVGAVAAMDVPLEQLPAGLDRAQAIFANVGGEADSFPTLYNPMGDLLLRSSGSGFAPFGARVADVEGVRRAAVLATQLRSHGVEMAKISAELATSTVRSPYDNTPFGWDAEEQAIVFVGLEVGERGRHLFKL